jgi:hypothetical protein
LQVQLTWTNPNTGDRTEIFLDTPVAIGSQISTMPQQIGEKRVSLIEIDYDLVADYHALIDQQNQELIVIDQNTSNGIKINGVQSASGVLKNGDRIQIGSVEIVVNIGDTAWECDRMVGFLFKRRCGRTDRTGCPYCNESYTQDYAYYPDYGSYRYGWGSSYYRESSYSYESETDNVDFTEADGESLEDERNTDFETNMGAS